jgi:hypothetical protein
VARKPAVVSKKKKSPNAHARDQFAALGRFIQNFEQIVSVLRTECGRLVRGGDLGSGVVAGNVLLFYWNISALAFHHDSMTAKPIVDIWQAMVSEQCRALVVLSKLSEEGQRISLEIVRSIANDTRDLANTRNTLVHASWNIGFWPPIEEYEDLSRIWVQKYRVPKDGLQLRDDLPRSFEQLMEYGNQAHRILGRLGRFLQFFIFSPEKIESVFSKKDGEWIFTRRSISPKVIFCG